MERIPTPFKYHTNRKGGNIIGIERTRPATNPTIIFPPSSSQYLRNSFYQLNITIYETRQTSVIGLIYSVYKHLLSIRLSSGLHLLTFITLGNNTYALAKKMTDAYKEKLARRKNGPAFGRNYCSEESA